MMDKHAALLASAIPLAEITRPISELFFDTARAVIKLFLSGTIANCPHITFIRSQ